MTTDTVSTLKRRAFYTFVVLLNSVLWLTLAGATILLAQ